MVARIFCLPYGILSLRSSDFVDDEPHGFSRHSAQKKEAFRLPS